MKSYEIQREQIEEIISKKDMRYLLKLHKIKRSIFESLDVIIEQEFRKRNVEFNPKYPTMEERKSAEQVAEVDRERARDKNCTNH